MDIRNFIYDQGVLGVTIATLLGFGGTNFISSIRKYIITPVIYLVFQMFGINSHIFKKRNTIWIIDILSSLIEFMIVILVVFVIYKYVIVRIFEKQIQSNEIQDKLQKRALLDVSDIRKELVSDVSDIKSEIVDKNIEPHYSAPKL